MPEISSLKRLCAWFRRLFPAAIKYQQKYILPNGQRLLTIAPTAVHYADEKGMWQEIDNTVQNALLGGKRVYQDTAGIG